jgi:hypothetical protein
MSSVDGVGRGYTFGPLEKRGMLAGLRTGQLAVFGTAFILGVIVLNIGGAAGPAMALVVVLIGAGLALLQPLGRGIDEWVPVMFRWFVGSATGKNQWFSTLPLLGNVDHGAEKLDAVDFTPGKNGKKRPSGPANRAKTAAQRKKAAALPPPLANLSILEVPVGDGQGMIGVVKDSKNGLYTGVLAVQGDAFSLLEQGEKERKLQAWADVLGNLARPGSYVHRVQWIERAVPDDGDALNRYLVEARVQDESAPTVRSYIDLLEEFGPVSQQHEVFIAIQINSVKAGRVVKKAGGGDKGACLVLLRELRQMADSLMTADISVNGVLSPRLLALTFRNAVDPENRRALVRRGRTDPERAGVAPDNAWAMATEAKWDHYKTDRSYHATYWISEWPRLDVGPDFMAPLMVRTQRIRTVSLVMQPIETGKAQKEIESAHTAYLSDEELRTRAGYVPTERRRREFEGVVRREQELANGFAEYRFAGYISVTASSLDELDEACAEVEQASQQCHIELRRLFGEQDVAFTCTLPLCRGLN